MMSANFTAAPPSALPPDPQKRVNYSLGLVLGVDEFEQEQFHLLERGRQHQRTLHGYGTVCGLEVTTNLSQVLVSPGLAIDPAGRVIQVARAQCADLDQWLSVTANRQAVSVGLAGGSGPTSVYVVLCYRECPTDDVPVPGAPCRSEDDTLAASRITETFELQFSPSPPAADEEQAVRAFGDLLRRIKITTANGPGTLLTVAEMERQVRALEAPGSPLGSPVTASSGPLLLHPADAAAVLRAGFRVWVTAVRPTFLPAGCGSPADACVLLSRLDFQLTPSGAVDPVPSPPITVSNHDRPCLVPTRLLQETLLGGLAELGEVVGSPLDILAGGLTGDVVETAGSTVVQALQTVPVTSTRPTDGQVLTFSAAQNRWQPTLPVVSGDVAGVLGGANTVTVQRLRNVSVNPTPPQVNQTLMAVPDGAGGVLWSPSPYTLAAAGYVPLGSAPPAGTTFNGLACDTPGAANSGQVLVRFVGFNPARQYVVRAQPSLEGVAAGLPVVPTPIYMGHSTPPLAPGLLLTVVDARNGTPVADTLLHQMRLMLEVSLLPLS